jgi:REP element-mobilizing transposase RayT
MAHSFTNLLYHLVFSTKERQPWLEQSLRPALWECLGGIIKTEGGIPLIINGVEDHVHILTKLRPDKSVSNVLGDLKSRSSGWVHRTQPHLEAFTWQAGYGRSRLASLRSKGSEDTFKARKNTTGACRSRRGCANCSVNTGRRSTSRCCGNSSPPGGPVLEPASGDRNKAPAERTREAGVRPAANMPVGPGGATRGERT